ncbi:MAG: hypothetical protein KDB73_17580 [Planctomycetes bacterium]|nr:hypothetical protein [Planctomycetota bacterium]
MAKSLIKNFGLFWERDRVEWGGRGQERGMLRGFRRGRRAQIVDFREQAGVYVLYEGENIATQRVTYVGQAGQGNASLFARLRQHQRDRFWNRWQRFSWFGLYDVGVNDTLIHVRSEKAVSVSVASIMDHIEGILIALFEPPLNRKGPTWGKTKNGKAAKEYIQFHEGRGVDVAVAIEGLRSQVAEVREDLGLPDR